MALLTVRELCDLLERIPRECQGVRMVYDGENLTLTDMTRHDLVAAKVRAPGVPEATWELTAYPASLATVRGWLRLQRDDEQSVGISPYWYRGDHRVVFTGCGTQLAFPVIDLPSAPKS